MISLLLFVLAVPAFLAAAYLAVASLLAMRPLQVPRPRAGRATSFVVVVPAHNEAQGLPATLASLATLEWPVAQRRTLVVADNCTDDTAAVAAAHGAEVLVRHDGQRRGKGYALAAAFAYLQAEPESAWDAVVVIDADSDVQPNLLAVAHARLASGADALQVPYLTRGVAHPMLAITEVALYASHVVRARARETCGLSVGLRGNGMVFSRRVLERAPYGAYSAIEDLEYGLTLARAGIRVAFAPGTTVRGEMPTDAGVATVQRTRWIGGRAALLRREVPSLLAAALRQRSLMLLDLAVDLLLPPLAALAALVLLGGGISLAWTWVAPAAWLAVLPWAAAAVALASHVLHAAAGSGQFAPFVRALRLLPLYIARKAGVTLRTLITPTHHWVRTARPGEHR